MRYHLFCACLALLASSVHAANWHVLQGGSGNGTTWSSPFGTLAAAETAAARGDTIYVGDGSYSSVTLNTANSGTTTITIRKATEAEHGSATGWSSAHGDGIATLGTLTINSAYWVIDGVTRASVSAGHGFYISAPGTGSKGITFGSGGNNCTIRYVEIEGNGGDGDGSGNDGIYDAAGADNVTISYCSVHDTGRTSGLLRGTTGWIIEYSYFARNESVSAEHSESWSIGVSNNITFRYNIFEECDGTGLIVVLDETTGPTGALIHGNTIIDGTFSNGMITTDTGSAWSGLRVYNNTIHNSTNASVDPDNGSDNFAQNNIWHGGSVSFGNTTHNYNWFYPASGTGGDQGEANGVLGSGDPFVDSAAGNFALDPSAAGSLPIDRGTNLGATYELDSAGTTRGADGSWDIGALELDQGGGGGNPGVLAFATDVYSVGEGDGTVTITVTRTGGSEGAVGVTYASSNGTAVSGSDYTAVNSTLSWADDETASKTFQVTITNDSDVEGNQAFTLTLTSPTGSATLGDTDTATVTIVDNDSAPTVPLMGSLTFEADAGLIESPMTDGGDHVTQSVTTTDPTQGGRVRWRVTIPDTGDYTVTVSATAPINASDTFFLEFDAEPTTADIVDLQPIVGDGETALLVTHRGAGTSASPQFNPQIWTLAAGEHTLYLRGREGGALIHTFEIAAVEEADTDAPTPDPATFATAPFATSQTAIAMTATAASDVTGPVEYFFDETSGNPGGTDSGWQSSASYTDTGLTAATQYTYRVRVRDAVTPTPNETAYSSTANATTLQEEIVPGVQAVNIIYVP
jgi:hypothetical protein